MQYSAGWHKQVIALEPDGYAMFGYGKSAHRALRRQSELHARAIVIDDGAGLPLVFCCLDLGCITWAIREGVCDRLQQELGAAYDKARLVLAATHTHSGPGGCSYEALYNFVTPGFVTAHVAAIVDAACVAIVSAWKTRADTEISFSRAAFPEETPVAWNRSLQAWNRNPDVRQYQEGENHLALDRSMPLIGLWRDGKLQALLSLFGVHATCVGSSLDAYDGDNKGYAAIHAEQALAELGARNPVSIFAQGTAGDVSPHYHGPGAVARRRKLRGRAEYAYARRNGRYQADCALDCLSQSGQHNLSGPLDGILSYVDFTAIEVDPRHANGHSDARTSAPCHGVAFIAGTPVDGPGIPKALAVLVRSVAGLVKRRRLAKASGLSDEEKAYYRDLYAAQGNKHIVLESGRKIALGYHINEISRARLIDPIVAELVRQKERGALRDSHLIPTILPLQLLRIGPIVMVCCPGEITGTSGRRIVETVQTALQEHSSDISEVWLCSYCNEYMGYVTTQEEYQVQAYEGGHTLYGQWTLAGFQTRFAQLAAEFARPASEREHDRDTHPPQEPPEELALRSDLPVPQQGD